MHFLKTLFWVIFAAGLVLFARENWVPVPINLWSGLVAEVKLPFLVAVVFLLGFLPTYLFYRGRMWTLRRQMTRPERVSVANQPLGTYAASPPPAPSEPGPAAEPAAPASARGPEDAEPAT
jgi:uncharacterized integral membrane protein